LRDALDQIKAAGGNLKLLIIDPLESFMGNVDTYKNPEVRQALNGVRRLAAEEKFTVLCIQHLTKKTGIDANHRIGGSIAFTALARNIWLFVRDPENPNDRLFLHSKTNVGRKMTGFHYSIETAENEAGMVAWGEPAYDDPDEVLNRVPTPAKRAPEQTAVLGLLENTAGNMTLAEIAKSMGKKKTAVSNILSKLAEQGKVYSTGHGQWSKMSNSPPPSIGKEA
jgi:hypothetical protein